jgi:organic hydroperoxide reductase OsmC/OhrA
MSDNYNAVVVWRRGEQPFLDRKYSRGHEWQFDGITVPASSSPAVVRLPLSKADAIDPEEALVASLAACHMLFFLDFAARAGFRIDEYRDSLKASMAKNEAGKTWVSRIVMHPDILFSGDKRPTAEDIAELHHKSHAECFIANSLRSEVVIETVPPRFA